MLKKPDSFHLLPPPQSEDFSLPPFPLPRTFMSERNSLGSVDWPPIGSSLLPKDGDSQKDDNTSLRSPVSDVPPRSIRSVITYLRSPRVTGMTRFFSVRRHYCRRSRNWMNLTFWRDIHHLTVTVGLLAQSRQDYRRYHRSRIHGIRLRSQVLGFVPNKPNPRCAANLDIILL